MYVFPVVLFAMEHALECVTLLFTFPCSAGFELGRGKPVFKQRISVKMQRQRESTILPRRRHGCLPDYKLWREAVNVQWMISASRVSWLPPDTINFHSRYR
jgi:hypothetical protein